MIRFPGTNPGGKLTREKLSHFSADQDKSSRLLKDPEKSSPRIQFICKVHSCYNFRALVQSQLYAPPRHVVYVSNKRCLLQPSHCLHVVRFRTAAAIFISDAVGVEEISTFFELANGKDFKGKRVPFGEMIKHCDETL